MTRRIIVFLLMVLICVNLVLAEDAIKCFGNECYKAEYRVPLKIIEVIINTVLHNDGSLTYSQTIGLEYQWENISFNKEGVMVPEFLLPQQSEVGTEIEVKELISDREFKQVYLFGDPCYGQFIFNRNKNIIELCTEPQNQFKFDIKTTILPDKNFLSSYLNNTDYSVFNNIELVFPPTDYTYFTSASMIGDEYVLVDSIPSDSCKETKGLRYNFSKINLIPKKNGFMCQGYILPVDKAVVFNLKATGKNFERISKTEEKEMVDLQKKNIAESINANKRTRWNILLTAILVVVTAIYAFVAHKTWQEMRRASMPLVSAKLDPLGISEVTLRILNIGNSTARNIKLKYDTKPNGPSGEWKYHLLNTGDFVRLVIKDDKGNGFPLQDFVNKYEKIVVNSTCEDIHKQSHPDNFDINLIDYRDSIKNNLWLWDTTFKEDIEQISKKIKDISDILKSNEIKINVKNMNIDPQKLKAEIKIYEKLLSIKKKKSEEFNKKENKNG